MAVSSQQIIDAYRTYLGRTPGSSEVNYWVNYSTTNGVDQTVAAFLAGSKNELSNVLNAAYQQTLGRTPAASEVNFWVDYTISNGFAKSLNDFTILANLEIEQRQATQTQPQPQPQPQPKPEPQPSVSEQTIRDVYQRYLNRSPDATELQGWLNYSKTNSPEQTANAFLSGARNELASVTQQGYQAALNRAPTEAEVRALVDYAIENGAQAAVDKFNTDARAELDRAKQPAEQPASAVNNIKRQLRAQYDAIVAQQPSLKYKFEDRLDRIFEGQAKMFADAGITDITQVG